MRGRQRATRKGNCLLTYKAALTEWYMLAPRSDAQDAGGDALGSLRVCPDRQTDRKRRTEREIDRVRDRVRDGVRDGETKRLFLVLPNHRIDFEYSHNRTFIYRPNFPALPTPQNNLFVDQIEIHERRYAAKRVL